jgi:hypothetical protein
MKITTSAVTDAERSAHLSMPASATATPDIAILIARGRALQAEAVTGALLGVLDRFKRLFR